MNAIEVDKLAYAYRAKKGARTVLENLSFSVGKGEIFGLLGPNGAGKTTLFRILSTIFPAPPGAVRVFGTDAAQAPDVVRRSIGVVFQSPALDKRLTVRENLTHQGHLYGLSGKLLKDRIDHDLKRVGLLDRAEEQAGTLSGGLQRRAELAKGLLHRPELLILDEPSTGLDPGSRKDMWNYLKELRAQDGATVLLTTHWMEEAEVCDRLAILHEGRIVAQGAPAELKGAIGGEVVSISTSDPEGLAGKIRERFKIEARVVDGTVRLERPDAHRLIPELAEAFGKLIESATLGKPTLEDVFIRATGHKFWREAAR